MRAASIIDKIFIRLTLFLIVFIIIGFYTGSNFSAIAGGIISVAIIELISKISSKHPGKRQIKRVDLKINKDLQNQLIFNEKENLEIFLKACKNFDNAMIEKDYIKFEKTGKKYIAFLNFSYEQLTKQDVLDFYRKAKKLKKDCCIIFASAVNPDVFSVINNFTDTDVKILSGFEVYGFLKKNGALPEIKKINKPKPDYTKILKRLFSRRNFKGYFACSIILFLFSFITPFKLYYRISTIVLLFAALICLIKRQPVLQDEF